MASDMNKVFLIGRLTSDPEIKQLGESQLANFILASNHSYVSNGNRKEEVAFFGCVIWGKQAEILKQYAGKGKQIAIEGRLTQETWDGQDGKKNSKTKIRVESFQLLGGTKPESHENNYGLPPKKDMLDDDSPF